MRSGLQSGHSVAFGPAQRTRTAAHSPDGEENDRGGRNAGRNLPVRRIPDRSGFLGAIEYEHCSRLSSRWERLPKSFCGSEIKFALLFVFVAGKTLPTTVKQKVFPNGTLIIENVERQTDQGTYTCVVKNEKDYTVRQNLEVQVLGELEPFHSSL